MFEFQAIVPLKSPSSVSLAVPAKVKAFPSTTDAPLSGAVIVTEGAILGVPPSVTVI